MTLHHATASTIALLLSVLALSGCGSEDNETPAVPTTQEPSASTASASASATPTADSSAAAPEEACPATLTDGRDGDAVPAEASDFMSDTPTWICRYVLDSEESTGRWNQWNLASTPVEIVGENTALVTALVEGLEPADEEAACTMDMGPRLLISHEVRDGEQAHLVINEFGCRDVTLAYNLMPDTLPWTAEQFTPTRTDVEALAALVPGR